MPSKSRSLLKRIFIFAGISRPWVLQSYWEFKILLIRLLTLSPNQRARLKSIKTQSDINLIFGVGDTSYDNWIGIDCFKGPNVDLSLDLRRKLPFDNESINLCYSEHFFEHLYPEDGQKHLDEVYRILKLGGRYRVAVPDAMLFAEKYLANDTEFFKLAFPWAERPMEAIYNIFNWGGEHRNIVDFNEMVHLGKLAGFSKVIKCEANQSEIPLLQIDKDDPQRIAETFYVELIKE